MSTVTIAPVTDDEVRIVAELLVSSFPDKFGSILGSEATALMSELYESRPARFVTDTRLARVDGTPAGFIRLDLGGSSFTEQARSFLPVAAKRYGRRQAFIRLLKVFVFEVPPLDLRRQELYVKTVGVVPGFRDHGVGTKLLAHAEEEARERGKRILSLQVISFNVDAIRLYQRLGFELGPRRESRALRWAAGRAVGYHKMVKPLS